MPTYNDESLLDRYRREVGFQTFSEETMNADKAHGLVAEMHDAVLSGKIDLDDRTMERMLGMIRFMANKMTNAVTDKDATVRFQSLVENAETALPDAVGEVEEEISDWMDTQAKLRFMRNDGRHVGALLITEA